MKQRKSSALVHGTIALRHIVSATSRASAATQTFAPASAVQTMKEPRVSPKQLDVAKISGKIV